MEPYEVAVVGAGMIGSAAARHLAEAGRRTVVVGPGEPPNLATATGPFASHYDSGRITRITDADPVWAELAARSIARYRDVERRSGITFHGPVGAAWIVDEMAEDLDVVVASANERGGSARRVDPGRLEADTGIRSPGRSGVECAWEDPPAGHVDPRMLVAAELALAVAAGATSEPSPVTAVERTVVGAERRFRLSGPFGSVDADQVLLATGAYGGHLVGIELPLIRQLRTIVRADIGPAVGMPSLLVHTVVQPELADVYWVPPVRFPDGKLMLKIGGAHKDVPVADDPADLRSWFRTGGSEPEALALVEAVTNLLPGAAIGSWDRSPCVVTMTPTGYPYLGRVDDGLAVAVAGNGSTGKSCDEIGRLAASLFQSGHRDPADHPRDPVIDGTVFIPPM